MLLLTDDAEIERMVRELDDGLGAPAMHLEVASGHSTGLARLQHEAFDVVLLDLQYAADAVSAMRDVREAAPEAAVIVLLQAASADLLPAALDCGADDYLVREAADSALLLRCLRHVLERRSLRRMVNDCERRLSQLWGRGDVGLLQLDLRGRTTAVNAALVRMLGEDREHDLLDVEFGRAFGGGTDFREWLRSIRFGRPRAPVPLRLQTKSGKRLSVLAAADGVHDGLGKQIGYQLTIMRLDQPPAALREPSYAERHDPLTAAYNQAMLSEQVEAALGGREDGVAYLVWLHLDHVSRVVDLCGLAGSRECMKQLAAELRAALRRHDLLARTEDGNFACLLRVDGDLEAWRLAKRLLAAVRAFEFRWGESFAVRLDGGIGIVALDASVHDSDSALTAAQEAAAATSADGAGSIRLGSTGGKRIDRRGVELERVARLKAAIAEGRLFLTHQPVEPLALRPAREQLVELFVRMVGPKGRAQLPAEFFPDLERYNLGTLVDRWVVGSAVRWMREDEGPHHLSCLTNLCAQSVAEPAFLGFLDDVLEVSGLSPERLCFEVAGGLLVEDLQAVASFLSALRGRGCRVVVDGIGGDGLPFGHLTRVEADWLKLHRSLTASICSDPVSRVIAKAVVEIGRTKGIPTIAPAVENGAELLVLEELGVDYVQGYAVCAPVPVDDISRG